MTAVEPPTTPGSSDAPLRFAVLGAGRAGRIRARDIAAEPGLTLVHHVPGRAPKDELRAAIRDPEVDAVVVCVENARHGDLCAAAIHAGKHALVEFPLCHTAAGAHALLGSALAAGKVVHLELIGLLTSEHQGLKAQVARQGIKALRVQFGGGLYRWVADEHAAGRVGQLAVGRLHALWDLCGPLHLDQVLYTSKGDEGYRLEVLMTGGQGEDLELIEERGPGLPRGASWVGLTRAGEPLQRLREGGGVPLFLQDLRAASARFRGDSAAAYVDDRAVLGVAQLAERISSMAFRAAGRQPTTATLDHRTRK